MTEESLINNSIEEGASQMVGGGGWSFRLWYVGKPQRSADIVGILILTNILTTSLSENLCVEMLTTC